LGPWKILKGGKIPTNPRKISLTKEAPQFWHITLFPLFPIRGNYLPRVPKLNPWERRNYLSLSPKPLIGTLGFKGIKRDKFL